MLQQLKANNVRICIATGRSPVTLPNMEGLSSTRILPLMVVIVFRKII